MLEIVVKCKLPRRVSSINTYNITFPMIILCRLILEKETYEQLLTGIPFDFIQLHKFNLGIDELVNPIDK